MNVCYKKIQINDFKPGTLLYLIAKENIQLACEVSEWLGGTNQYIHQLHSIEQTCWNRTKIFLASMLDSILERMPGKQLCIVTYT